MTHATLTTLNRASGFATIHEIAADLDRPDSTIRHWAAGDRSDFPPVVQLPNKILLVDTADLRGWYELLAISDTATDRDRAGAARGVRRLNQVSDRSRVRCMTLPTTPSPEDPSWQTLAELASTLRQSYSTVSQWCRRRNGDFPAHVRLPNNKVLVHVDDRDKWLRERRS